MIESGLARVKCASPGERYRWLMRTLAALVFVAGCFPWANGDDYVPVTVAVYPGGAEVAAPRPPPASGACDEPTPDISTCSPVATVRVRGLVLDPRCFYDNRVSDGEVGRVMQCPNEAMIVFERASFVGEASAGYVDACTTSAYDFPQGDDCTWRTEQRIEGPASGPLSYTYTEAPVAGRACTLACRTTATLDVVE